MKNFFNLKQFLTFWALFIFAFSLIACENTANESGEETTVSPVVITIDSDFAVTDDTTLIDYMNYLKSQNELNFTITNGMVDSFNGVKNTGDFSKCWMLYTDDADYSNQAWGSINIDGVTYNSAVLGANDLPITQGKTYIWVYQSF